MWPARSGPHPVETDPAVRARLACREQPRGLLVLVAAQGQVRDPDEYLRDQGCVPRLGRRLAGRYAVRPGLAEIVGQVAE